MINLPGGFISNENNVATVTRSQNRSPLSESDLSDDMAEPWLLLRILSEPLCSCSSRTLSSLCSQRRRPFICSARSSCSCSFCRGDKEGRRLPMQKLAGAGAAWWREERSVLPWCAAAPASRGWGWCSSPSRTTAGFAPWAAPGSASAELVCKGNKSKHFLLAHVFPQRSVSLTPTHHTHTHSTIILVTCFSPARCELTWGAGKVTQR